MPRDDRIRPPQRHPRDHPAREPALAHRLGGSHAQRDVLHLTLLHAIERIRRPAPRLRRAFLPIAAQA